MRRWEYKIITKLEPLTSKEFADLGHAGWEMCGVFHNRPTGTAGHYIEKIVYHFKRPLPEKELVESLEPRLRELVAKIARELVE